MSYINVLNLDKCPHCNKGNKTNKRLKGNKIEFKTKTKEEFKNKQ